MVRRVCRSTGTRASIYALSHFVRQGPYVGDLVSGLRVPSGFPQNPSLFGVETPQEAAKRAIDARTQILRVDLERARQSHAKIKKDTTEREKFLGKVQGVWNERKKMSSELEAKVRLLELAIGATCATERGVCGARDLKALLTGSATRLDS